MSRSTAYSVGPAAIETDKFILIRGIDRDAQ